MHSPRAGELASLKTDARSRVPGWPRGCPEAWRPKAGRGLFPISPRPAPQPPPESENCHPASVDAMRRPDPRAGGCEHPHSENSGDASRTNPHQGRPRPPPPTPAGSQRRASPAHSLTDTPATGARGSLPRHQGPRRDPRKPPLTCACRRATARPPQPLPSHAHAAAAAT